MSFFGTNSRIFIDLFLCCLNNAEHCRKLIDNEKKFGDLKSVIRELTAFIYTVTLHFESPILEIVLVCSFKISLISIFSFSEIFFQIKPSFKVFPFN